MCIKKTIASLQNEKQSLFEELIKQEEENRFNKLKIFKFILIGFVLGLLTSVIIFNFL